MRFHIWIDSPDYRDKIHFQLLDVSSLAILDSEITCDLLGVLNSPVSSWLYEIWIDGAFDSDRPTAIWIDGKECPFVHDPYDAYSPWTGSGAGTTDEIGQINMAAVSGTDTLYGGYGAPYLLDTEARFIRIRNGAVFSQNGLSLKGVMTRIPTTV